MTVGLKKDSLSQGHRKAMGLDDAKNLAKQSVPAPKEGYARTMERFFTSDRAQLLKDIPPLRNRANIAALLPRLEIP